MFDMEHEIHKAELFVGVKMLRSYLVRDEAVQAVVRGMVNTIYDPESDADAVDMALASLAGGMPRSPLPSDYQLQGTKE